MKEPFELCGIDCDRGWEKLYKPVIDKINEYNNQHPEHTIAGITLDIEPYGLADYQTDIISGFETYANTIEEAYAYAHSKNIRFVNAIPYWYDNYMTKELYTTEEQERAAAAFKKIIQNTDKISVMNYLKRNMTSHMENEIFYAQIYNVEIESVADFCETTGTTVLDEATFYVEEDPIVAANDMWSEIYKTYHYDKLNFSYHHLGILLEMDIFQESFRTPDEESAEQQKNNDKATETQSPSNENHSENDIAQHICSEKELISIINAPEAEYTCNAIPIDVLPYSKTPTLWIGQTITLGINQYQILNEKEVAFVGITDTSAIKISIPKTITMEKHHFAVTTIENNALRKSNVTNVIMGSNIRLIKTSAFENCKRLNTVTLSSKTSSIGKNAFKNCISLKRIIIPSKVSRIPFALQWMASIRRDPKWWREHYQTTSGGNRPSPFRSWPRPLVGSDLPKRHRSSPSPLPFAATRSANPSPFAAAASCS